MCGWARWIPVEEWIEYKYISIGIVNQMQIKWKGIPTERRSISKSIQKTNNARMVQLIKCEPFKFSTRNSVLFNNEHLVHNFQSTNNSSISLLSPNHLNPQFHITSKNYLLTIPHMNLKLNRYLGIRTNAEHLIEFEIGDSEILPWCPKCEKLLCTIGLITTTRKVVDDVNLLLHFGIVRLRDPPSFHRYQIKP